MEKLICKTHCFHPFAYNGAYEIMWGLDRFIAISIGSFTCMDLYGDMTRVGY